MKRYFVVGVLFLFGCMGAWQASNGAEAERANGEVVITEAPALTATELAGILGTHVWKCHVAVPQGKARIRISLQQRGTGLLDHVLSGGIGTIVSANGDVEVLVAIVPVEGADLAKADHIRIMISANGDICETTAENPLKGMAIGGPISPAAMGDGAFALIGGFSGNTVTSPISSNADRLISLKIKFE